MSERRKGRAVAAVGTVGVVLAGFGVLQLVGGSGNPVGPRSAAADDHLRPYASCDALLSAYRGTLQRSAGAYGFGGNGPYAIAAGKSDTAAAVAPGAETAADSAVGAGETGTNVQEQGVDEPDVAKVVAGRLVTLTGGDLEVLTADATPHLLGRLAVPGQVDGTELLLVGDRALVIEQGFTGRSEAMASSGTASSGSGVSDIAPVEPGRTVLRLADLSDPAHPHWLETWSIDGAYVSARLVDGTVRLVTTTTPTPEAVYPKDDSQAGRLLATMANKKAAGAMSLDDLLPRATRTDTGGHDLSDGPALPCDAVSFAPAAQGADLTVVTSLRPASGLAPIDSTGMTAPGDLVYAASDRLVVATTSVHDGAESTQLHTFDTSSPSGKVQYVASGSVPGHVLGRWALSWQDGVLRVATTSTPAVATPVAPSSMERGDGTSSNGPVAVAPGAIVRPSSSSSSVTTLRESGSSLVVAGTVGGLGAGEQIKAVRYVGELAIVVTFRQTDPLYVVDLSDPAHPLLRGELKVTGFSTYLHPIGDDRLLGVGMAADPRTGRTTGMQASVFDLSDLSAPTQVSRLDLGQGWSPALDDSRAFTYDPAGRLALLPLQAFDAQTGEQGVAGAVGISISADGQLHRLGTLATGQDSPARVLMSGGTVLAVGPGSVVAADAGTLVQTGSARL